MEYGITLRFGVDVEDDNPRQALQEAAYSLIPEIQQLAEGNFASEYLEDIKVIQDGRELTFGEVFPDWVLTA